jgi:predicted nucleic acid-binding protein
VIVVDTNLLIYLHVEGRRTTRAEAVLRRDSAREYAVASQQVLLRAEQSGCSADDREFVSLAQELGVRLVTAERQVHGALPAVAVAPAAFAA